MSKIITTDNGQKYQTPTALQTTGAILGGSFAGAGVTLASLGVNVPCMNKMKELASSTDTVQLTKAVSETFGGGHFQLKVFNL